jgi:hypothetical protein
MQPSRIVANMLGISFDDSTYSATYRLANSRYLSANDPIDNIYVFLFYTLYNLLLVNKFMFPCF